MDFFALDGVKKLIKCKKRTQETVPFFDSYTVMVLELVRRKSLKNFLLLEDTKSTAPRNLFGAG